jgi:CheY-like chemotaxis protein
VKLGQEFRPRILVADDDPDVRELLSLVLQSEGFDVIAVGDGDAAIAATRGAHSAPFFAAIMDVTMPKVDGVALAMALRGDRATWGIKLIFHTGHAESEIRRRFDDYDAYVRKPAYAQKLVATIRKVMLPYALASSDAPRFHPDPISARSVRAAMS